MVCQNILRCLLPSCLFCKEVNAYEPYIDNDLYDADKDIKLFSFNEYECYAKIVYVYDGDTVHIVIPFPPQWGGGGKLVKIKTRLNGIDTPELRIAEQKERGLLAKKRLEEIISETNNIVYVKCGKFDKYGRVLVDLYTNNDMKTHINMQLVNEGHAYEYDGGTKKI